MPRGDFDILEIHPIAMAVAIGMFSHMHCKSTVNLSLPDGQFAITAP
jgi:hypothetical protein